MRKLCSAASILLVFVATAFACPTVAQAVQNEPHDTRALYITTNSLNAIETYGENHGTTDLNNGYLNRFTILAFGAQQNGGGGTYYPGTMTPISNADIKAVAKAYAHSWWSATGTNLSVFNTIAIGTNNSRSGGNTAANGEIWADLVDSLNTYAASQGWDSQLAFHGGNDIEPSWGGSTSAADTIAWSDSYNNHSAGGYMYDFGSADGCPQTTHTNGNCNNGWTRPSEIRPLA